MLSQHHTVKTVDIIPEEVELINNRRSPIHNKYIEKYLKENGLNLMASADGKTAYTDADIVVIVASANYDSRRELFDTSVVENVMKSAMKCAVCHYGY